MKRRTKNLLIGHGMGWSGVLLGICDVIFMCASEGGGWHILAASVLAIVACVLCKWGSIYLYAEGIDIYQVDGPWDKTGKY